MLPVSFLTTELVELATLINPHAIMHISAGGSAAVESQPTPHRATLRVQSEALVASPAMSDYLHHRFGRILTGLSRQLRAPLSMTFKRANMRLPSLYAIRGHALLCAQFLR